MLPTVVAAVLVSNWFVQHIWPQHRLLAALLMIGLVGTNLLLIDLSNREPRLAPRTLARLLEERPGSVIYTDPRTHTQSDKYKQWRGVDTNRSVPTPPPPGGLFLYHRPNVASGQVHGRSFNIDDFKPGNCWNETLTTRGRITVLGWALSLAGVTPELTSLPERVYWANVPVTLYRVNSC
jgi:hypothetical protein